jgi:2-dehydro-3-deoxyphosphogluconate aldolase/(4S)-4-hydroxy-2-oxoglutarate aldolase
VEVLLRTEKAYDAIRLIATECPNILVIAGTVKSTTQVDAAVIAGAKAVITPGFNIGVVKYCLDQGIPIIPGTSVPSDFELALDCGLDLVKLFHAGQLGGPEYIKAVTAPYPELLLVPTGGVSAENLKNYLRLPNVAAAGGTWIIPEKLVSARNFAEITRLATEAVMLALDLTVNIHLGINGPDADTALADATKVGALFGLPVKNGSSSVFAGTVLEFLKTPGRGQHGHIAIGTSSIPRALAYLERKGIKPLPGTANPPTGKIKAIYLDLEVGGFPFHLLQTEGK